MPSHGHPTAAHGRSEGAFQRPCCRRGGTFAAGRPTAFDTLGGSTLVGERLSRRRRRSSGAWRSPYPLPCPFGLSRALARAPAASAGRSGPQTLRPDSAWARLRHERALDKPGKQGRAEGDRRIIEVVAIVVHGRAGFTVAEVDIGAGHLLEHEGKIF